jgi:hypothetical protein
MSPQFAHFLPHIEISFFIHFCNYFKINIMQKKSNVPHDSSKPTACSTLWGLQYQGYGPQPSTVHHYQPLPSWFSFVVMGQKQMQKMPNFYQFH